MSRKHLAKWLSVRLRTNWLWVRVPLQSHKVFNSTEVTSYPRMCKTFHLLFFLHFFIIFKEKNPPIRFYGVFVYFLRPYEVAKFWMIELYLDVSVVIRANKHTKYANCGLPVNVLIFLLCHSVLWQKMIVLSKSPYFGITSPWRTYLYNLGDYCVTFFISVNQTSKEMTLFLKTWDEEQTKFNKISLTIWYVW